MLALASAAGTGSSSAAQGEAAPEIQGPTAPVEGAVVAIEVVGNSRYTDEQLLSMLGLAVGSPIDPDAVSNGVHALLRSFRVRASVEKRAVAGGYEVRLSVVELPFDLEPRFVGNVEVSLDDLREWARIGTGTELYLHQAPRIRERLIAAYKRHGYYFVEINEVVRESGVDEAGDPIAPDVIFEIREGPQVHVRAVIIAGNEAMPDRGMLMWKDGLREFADVQLKAPRFFGLFKDEFDPEVLEGDLQAMRQVFRDRGWLDVVVQAEPLEFSDDRSWVTIRVRVDQGRRYTVGSLAIEGVERYDSASGAPAERPTELLFSADELRALCQLQPGEFFEARYQARDARALLERYGENGYLAHDSLKVVDRFEFLPPRLVFEAGDPVVHVTYRLAQGRQQFLREILISGNTNTADRVIRGQLTIKPGELADLTQISRSRARIQSLGFFSDARPAVAHVDPYFRFLDTDDPSWKDLEYVVDETNALGFNLSGGISSTTGLFGILEIKKQNFDVFDVPSSLGDTFDEIANGRAFHGAGQTLQLLLAPGTQTSAYEVRFREPDIFRRYVDRIGLDLLARRRQRIFDSHDERREEYGAALRYQVGPDSYVRLGYTAGPLEVFDLDGGGETTLGDPLPVPQLLKDQEGSWHLGWLDLSYEFSALDDYYYPQNGNTFETGLQVYGSALGSDFDFLKLTSQWRHLGQFGEESIDAHPGFELELRGGVAVPYGGSDDVPYSERFYLGGQRLMRGFGYQGVGPNEKGTPIGGETFAFFSAEYRQPVIKTIQPGTFREVEVVRAGGFLDVGVLDPDAFRLDLAETRASIGFFVGLTLPLPFTLSYSIPIRTGDGDDQQRIQFNIGF
jgi:outer membrane protein insertion porin family